MSELAEEDAKLVVLARGAMGRAGAAGRRGAGPRRPHLRRAPVSLDALTLTALQAAVAAAVSSGAQGLEAAVLVGGSAVDAGVAAVRELSGRPQGHRRGRAGTVLMPDGPPRCQREPNSVPASSVSSAGRTPASRR